MDWALEVLQSEVAENWERAQAMTFFAKLQHLVPPPAPGEVGETPMDKFLAEMARIRDVPYPVKEETPEDDDLAEDESDDSAEFEAPAV